MKKTVLAALTVISLTFPAAAQKWNLVMDVSGEKVSGYTDYHITIPTLVSVTNGVDVWDVPATVNSVLAFPIDGFRGEIKGTVSAPLKGRKLRSWGLIAIFSTKFTDPSEAMIDSDYVLVPSLVPSTYILGATKSEAEISDYALTTSLFIKAKLGKNISLEGSAGYEFNRYKYEIIGLTGWYDFDLDGVTDPVDFSPYQGMNVLDYKVTYNLVSLGLELEFAGNNDMNLVVGGKWYPMARAKDLDDHLLRHKTAESDCDGNGFALKAGTRIRLQTFKQGSGLYLTASYGITRITTEGTQVQKYYGDDPGSADDETGLVMDGIQSSIKMKKSVLSAGLEYRF